MDPQELVEGENLRVSAVIPAYFEEKTIGEVVSLTLPFVDEVIVVDDGSSDETSLRASEAGARVIRNEANMGVLSATRRGLREAVGAIIVTLDADGQHDPSEIPGLIAPIREGRADLVMGVRPSFPYWSERILTVLTSLRVPCRDASTGFRAMRKTIAEKMELHGECLCGTLVLEAHRHGARVTDVPVTIGERREGERRIQTRHFKQFFHVLYGLLR